MPLYVPKRFSLLKGTGGTVAPGLQMRYLGNGNVLDMTGNTTATAQGSLAYSNETPYGRGQSFLLNGTNAWVRVTYNSVLAVTSTETLSLWFRIDSLAMTGYTNSMNLVAQSHYAVDNDFNLGYNLAGRLLFFWYNAGAVSAPLYRFNALTWYHAAVVVDTAAGFRSLYLNGELVGRAAAATRPSTTDDWAIGYSLGTSNQYFKGLITDVRMYNVALTSDQLKQSMGIDHYVGSRRRRKIYSSDPSGQPVNDPFLKCWLRGEGNTLDTTGKCTAAAVGAVTYAAGNNGQAFVFDGTDYVQITYNEHLHATDALTLMCWFRLASAPVGIWHVFGQSTNGNDNDLLFNNATNALLYYGFGAGFTCAVTFSTLTWYHVAVVCSAGMAVRRFFVNGVGSTQSAGTARANSTNNWSIAESLVFPNRKFKGMIEDARIYTRPLTQAEIVLAMNESPLYAERRPQPETLYDVLVTNSTNNGGAWELGEIFTVTLAGMVTKVRLYAITGESGTHTARLWITGTSTLLAGPWSFTAVGPGWVEYALPTPVRISAFTSYTLSISTGTDGSRSECTYTNTATNYKHIYHTSGAYTSTLGTMPTTAYTGSFLRDIVFVPDPSSLAFA